MAQRIRSHNEQHQKNAGDHSWRGCQPVSSKPVAPGADEDAKNGVAIAHTIHGIVSDPEASRGYEKCHWPPLSNVIHMRPLPIEQAPAIVEKYEHIVAV